MSLTTVSPEFAVYVHWPFCLSKCPYCDFNSHVRHGGYDEAHYVRAIQTEIAAAAARAPGRDGVDDLLRRRHAVFDAAANRRSDSRYHRQALDCRRQCRGFTGSQSDQRRLDALPRLSRAGVNRVSLGVQALDDQSLKELGRLHSAQEALDAVAVARSIFDRYSFDLIYARPRQTLEGWKAELKLAISEAAEHLSLYQLTIEPGTPFFGLHKAGKLIVPDDDHGRDLYDLTQVICNDAGLPAYEVSNHARPGAECRHNLVYWRGHEYAGVGPGAHGRLNIDGRRYATETEKKPEAWLDLVERAGPRPHRRREIAAERSRR